MVSTSPSFAERVSAVIRAVTAARGMNQATLAKAVGMNASALGSRWRDERQWQLEDIEKVADVFGITAEELVAAARWSAR